MKLTFLFYAVHLLVILTFSAKADDRLRLRPRGMVFADPAMQPSNETDDQITGGVTGTMDCEPENNFLCVDESACIDIAFECDNFTDCADNSDEHESCIYFSCGGSLFVNEKFLCDGISDCYNSNDEDNEHANCTIAFCADGSLVNEVYGDNICNGVSDCQDAYNSDECNCSFTFVCANNRCINENQRCNGDDDCGDGSDEVGCEMFDCVNGNRLLKNQICDGIDQCGDSSDECNCQDTFNCTNGRCVLRHQRCNRQDDCHDTSDECDCENMFMCSNGRCILDYLVGNGIDDCDDNSDELEPTDAPATSMAFMTSRGESKAPMTSSDVTKTPRCGEMMLTCPTGECISMTDLCDGKEDCGDGDDEGDCFRCREGSLIYTDLVCDGEEDCPGGVDECNCDDQAKQPLACGPQLIVHETTKFKLSTTRRMINTPLDGATEPTSTVGSTTLDQAAPTEAMAETATGGGVASGASYAILALYCAIHLAAYL